MDISTVPQIRSRIIRGEPGSGKSEAIISWLLPLIESMAIAIIVMDPHGLLVRKLMLILASRGRTRRVLFDRLGRMKRVLPAIRWEVSTSADPLEREKENNSLILGVMEIFYSAAQADGDSKLVQHRMLYKYLFWGLHLILHQPTPVPLSALSFAYEPKHPYFRFLVCSCTHPKARRVFERVERLSETQLDNEVGAAQRVVDLLYGFPEFRTRIGGGDRIRNIIKNHGIVLLDASEASPIARTALIRTWDLAIYRELGDLFNETATPHLTLIVCDESSAINAIGNLEIDFGRERRKHGGAIWWGEQDDKAQTLDIREAKLSVCPEHIYFRQAGRDAVMQVVNDIGLATLNPNEIHHHTEKQRPRLKLIPKTSTTKHGKGESVTEGFQFINDPETYFDPVFRSPSDQILDLAPVVPNLKPGQYLIRTPDFVSREPQFVKMTDDPYPADELPGLADKVFEQSVTESQSKSEFVTPALAWIPQCPNQDSTTTPTAKKGSKRPSQNLPKRRGQ